MAHDVVDPIYINNSELVLYLQQHGIAAHRGVPRERLLMMYGEVMSRGYTEEQYPNENDSYREEMMKYLSQYAEVLLPQLGCDGNCWNHPDAQVAACVLRIRGKLNH